MEKTSKMQTRDLYEDRNVQVFLSKILDGEINQVEPIHDSKLGYRYPVIESIIGENRSSEAFLNKLYENGILERKLYDKIVKCPKCGSANSSVRYCCPYCKSFNVQKSSLIEHVKCGYMDVEHIFRRTNRLVCPKCREALRKLDIDYRKAGIWCNCEECDKSFDIPIAANFCRDCRIEFSFEEAIINDAYAYIPRPEARALANMGRFMVTPITDFLKEEGYNVESPAFVKGKSGANHMFDIVAFDNETEQKITVIDLATAAPAENVVSEQPIIALFAKIFDVSPDSAYLIAIPKISENARKMAELYNIRILEANNQKEAVKILRDAVSE